MKPLLPAVTQTEIRGICSNAWEKVARQYVCPRNPRTPEPQGHRWNLRAVLRRWRTLSAEQRAAWCRVAATRDFVTETARRMRLNGYNFFASLNTRRADLDLPQFDLPPAEPVFSPNPVAELVITNTGGKITLKLRVPSPPAQHTLVQGPAPVRSGARCVQHFPFLGLLPAPADGWSDITELYVARHGVPKVGMAVWIRTCLHIDGWTDALAESLPRRNTYRTTSRSRRPMAALARHRVNTPVADV